MGYEAGKGLGKNKQGRVEIVEAFLRKGRGAIGAYGREAGVKKAEKKSALERAVELILGKLDEEEGMNAARAIALALKNHK